MAVFARASIAPAEVSSAEDSRAYIVDFVCHERMLVIELDGGQHVGSPADTWLESRGPGYCGSGTTTCWRREVVLEVILVL